MRIAATPTPMVALLNKPTPQRQLTPINHDTEPRFGGTKGQRYALLTLALLSIGGLATMYEATTGTIRDQLWAPSPETTLSSKVQVSASGRVYVKSTRHYPLNEKRILTPMAAHVDLELIPMDPQQSAASLFTNPQLSRADRKALSDYSNAQIFKRVDDEATATLTDPNAESGQKYQAIWGLMQNRVTPKEQRDPAELAKTLGTVTLRGTEFTVRIISSGAANCRLLTEFTD